ncbi:MAG: cupin domain-containing protein [Candidatus Saliniplasma sp.]
MECKFVKKGDEKEKRKVDGKLFRLLQKSEEMEAIIAELDVDTESDRYCHEGEEIHLVLSGTIEYTVGDEVHKMEAGDTLWHPSDISHHAKNIGKEKAVYLTVSTPPTFM